MLLEFYELENRCKTPKTDDNYDANMDTTASNEDTGCRIDDNSPCGTGGDWPRCNGSGKAAEDGKTLSDCYGPVQPLYT